MSVATFIATQRVEYQVPHATSCRALEVSQAWFYKWRHGDPSARHARREQLADRDRAVVRRPQWPLRLAADHCGSARGGLGGECEHRRSDHGRARVTGPGAPAATADHPAGSGSVAGSGPGQPAVRSVGDQPEVVRRRHRDHHRRGQVVPGQRPRPRLPPGDRVRPVNPSRHRPGLRRAGDGGRGPRRQGRDRRGDLPLRPGWGIHRPPVPGSVSSGWGSGSRWAGPGRRWTTR